MADWYNKTLSKIGKGLLDLDNLSNPKIVPVTSGYVFNQAHEFYSDITPSERVAVEVAMVNVTFGPYAVSIDIADVFSIDLWTGDGTADTITNGVDLLNEGGMVWWNLRASTSIGNVINDTERGLGLNLISATSAAEVSAPSGYVEAYNSDGYDIGTVMNWNALDSIGVTFRKAPNFFDVITYTGDGSSTRLIPHNLTVPPGMVIVKRRDSNDTWVVQHIARGGGKFLEFSDDVAETTSSSVWDDTSADADNVTIGSSQFVNLLGDDYVMYVFSHDLVSSGVIQCGGYSGDDTADGSHEITLGWRPQYIMFKQATGTGRWLVLDTVRGIVNGGNDSLWYSSNSLAEGNGTDLIDLTDTGFNFVNATSWVNALGSDYIYMAIREVDVSSIATSGNDGWLDADDPVIIAPTVDDVIEAFVMLNDTGVEATSPILFYSDSAPGLPYTVETTGAITVQLGADGIAKL